MTGSGPAPARGRCGGRISERDHSWCVARDDSLMEVGDLLCDPDVC
jgi:hypothetical protein